MLEYIILDLLKSNIKSKANDLSSNNAAHEIREPYYLFLISNLLIKMIRMQSFDIIHRS